MKRKIIISVIFMTGLLIFIYPMISNWFSTKAHYAVMSKHNEILSQMTEEEKEKERERAESYNASLNASSPSIEDPFSDQTSDDANQAYYNVLNIGETMGSIEIPVIDVNLPIYHGVGEDVLQRGVGHMSNSSLPVGGLGTHAVLTGHRGLPSAKLFRDLDKVKIDDVFYIHTLADTLAYKVDDIRIVLPTEVDWFEMDPDKDYVTLITCDPYMINTHRLLVRGERIPYDREEVGDGLEFAANRGDRSDYSLLFYILSGIVLALVLSGSFYIIRQRLREWKG